MNSEEKTTGEIIVEMLCEGYSASTIMENLNIKQSCFDSWLRKYRLEVGLPYEKKAYRARKDDIMENMKKFKEFERKIQLLRVEYRQSLVDFDF